MMTFALGKLLKKDDKQKLSKDGIVKEHGIWKKVLVVSVGALPVLCFMSCQLGQAMQLFVPIPIFSTKVVNEGGTNYLTEADLYGRDTKYWLKEEETIVKVGGGGSIDWGSGDGGNGSGDGDGSGGSGYTDYNGSLRGLQTDAAAIERERTIMSALQRMGYNDVSIAAIVACMAHESTTHNPQAVQGGRHTHLQWCEICRKDGKEDGELLNGGGHAFGIAQWDGGRRSELVKYAGERKWYDMNVQLEYLKLELSGAYSSVCGTSNMNSYSALVGSVAIATYEFGARYEAFGASACPMGRDCPDRDPDRDSKTHNGSNGYKIYLEHARNVGKCICDNESFINRIVRAYQYLGKSSTEARTLCHQEFCLNW
jgi:hypothetical protein